MSAFLKLSRWLEAHRDVAFDLLRMYLGVGLFARGILFVVRPEAYTTLISAADASVLTSPPVMYLVATVHVIGGLMLAVGFYTRLAALINIPILLGALVLIHLQGGLFTASQSFEFSALVLFLLFLAFLHGSGRWSVDARRTPQFVPFQKYVDRLDRSGDVAFELLRIYLGVGLFVRGILFISNSSAFMELLGSSSAAWLTSVALIHYVALSHLVGGIMIAIGLFTRAAALVQLPALVGAVFVVHFQGGLLAPSQSLEFSALVLFLLVLVFLWGSGNLSVDNYVIEQPVDEELYRHAGSLGARSTEPEPLLSSEPTTTMRHARCSCGHGVDHPRVTAHARYSMWGAMYFLSGITGPPKEIVFSCGDCGEVIAKSHEPEVLERYRYP
ncbi:MAG: DoxX family protein [Rhodothermales bacterium]